MKHTCNIVKGQKFYTTEVVSTNLFTPEAYCECSLISGFVYLFIYLRKKEAQRGELGYLYLLLCNQVLLNLFRKPHKNRWLGMVTIQLEVLQAHSFQQRYVTVRYPGWDVSIAARNVCLQQEEETKAALKAEAPETHPWAAAGGKAGAAQALGVIFSSPVSLLKSVSDSLLWFWLSFNLYEQLLSPEWGTGKDARKLSWPDNRNLMLGMLQGFLPSLVIKNIHFLWLIGTRKDTSHKSVSNPASYLYSSWPKVEPLQMFLLCLARRTSSPQSVGTTGVPELGIDGSLVLLEKQTLQTVLL